MAVKIVRQVIRIILPVLTYQNHLLLSKFPGISGAKVDEEALEVDRIGFQSMLDALTTQPIDAVVVLNTSRLWRSDIVKAYIRCTYEWIKGSTCI